MTALKMLCHLETNTVLQTLKPQTIMEGCQNAMVILLAMHSLFSHSQSKGKLYDSVGEILCPAASHLLKVWQPWETMTTLVLQQQFLWNNRA